MGLLKDFYYNELTMRKLYWPREILNPFNWHRTIKYRHQRAERGWSDKDTWGGGEYILEVVSGVLKKLGDDKSHVDWKEYFKTNYPNNEGYKNLQQVTKDIDNYLAFDDSGWVNELGFEIKHGSKDLPNGNTQLLNLNSPEENRKIKKAIEASHKEWDRRYKKAKKAMNFVATNFPGLWD